MRQIVFGQMLYTIISQAYQLMCTSKLFISLRALSYG